MQQTNLGKTALLIALNRQILIQIQFLNHRFNESVFSIISIQYLPTCRGASDLIDVIEINRSGVAAFYRSSYWTCSMKYVLKNVAKFTEKHLFLGELVLCQKGLGNINKTNYSRIF